MKQLWLKPSLSRDFALLSAAILFILFMVSTWVTYVTYAGHTERITSDLGKDALRIESMLAVEMQTANYMLNSLGREIVINEDKGKIKIAQILKSFDVEDHLYSIFSWVGPDQHVLVSSGRGVLEKPVDISDRDYVKRVITEPWRMNIGRPIEGRVSNRWVIPVAMGVTDYTGKFIGTLMVSLDINVLKSRLETLIKRDGISFAIVSKSLIPLAQVSDNENFVSDHFPVDSLMSINFGESPTGLLSKGRLFWGTGTYAYYHNAKEYPYMILVGYDSHYTDATVRNMLWSRLLQMLVMAAFFVLFLWVVRARMIAPILKMTSSVEAVANGKPYTELPQHGPMEIEALSKQLKRVGEYVAESKRIEEELRHKMYGFKQARERAEMDKRSLMEFMAYVCQELHSQLSSITNSAQIMKEQMYGPIGNAKYTQYISEMHTSSNVVLDNIQDLQLYSKAGTDYIDLVVKTVDIASVINKALRFTADRLQTEKLSTKVTIQDPIPKLTVDEFRLQQVIMNLMLYIVEHAMPQATIQIDAKLITENKDKQFIAIVLRTDNEGYSDAVLAEKAERMLFNPPYQPRTHSKEELETQPDLRLELARTLVELHHGVLDVTHGEEGSVKLAVMFGSGRIRFSE